MDSIPATGAQAFQAVVAARRTYYALSKASPISDARIQEIISHALLHVPSSFNSQSARIILLLGVEHDQLWDIVTKILRDHVPPERFAPTEKKLSGFKAGYGTILFFDDLTIVQGMQDKFPSYAQKFPVWAAESNAMLQFAIWTALEAEGLGANLQHYHPLINEKVQAAWNVPATWDFRAQMVFGAPVTRPAEKSFTPVEGERLLVYGA